MPQKKSVAQLCVELGFNEKDEEGISDIGFPVLSPLTMHVYNQPAPLSKFPPSGETNSFQMAQHNSAVQYAVQSVHSGGVVNMNFVTNPRSTH